MLRHVFCRRVVRGRITLNKAACNDVQNSGFWAGAVRFGSISDNSDAKPDRLPV